MISGKQEITWKITCYLELNKNESQILQVVRCGQSGERGKLQWRVYELKNKDEIILIKKF